MLLPNEKRSFNALPQRKRMRHRAILLSNTNPFKFVLFVNSNAWALCKKTLKLISNVTEHNYSMRPLLFNKRVPPVSLKIS